MELQEIRDWHHLTQVQVTQNITWDAGNATSLPATIRTSTRGELPFLEQLEIAELVMVQPVALRIEHEQAVSTDFPLYGEQELSIVYERGISTTDLGVNVADDGNGALDTSASAGSFVQDIDSIWRADVTTHKEFEDTTNGTAGGGSENTFGGQEPLNFRLQFGHGPLVTDEEIQMANRIDLPGNAEGVGQMTTALNLYWDTYELEETVQNVVG